MKQLWSSKGLLLMLPFVAIAALRGQKLQQNPPCRLNSSALRARLPCAPSSRWEISRTCAGHSSPSALSACRPFRKIY